MFIAPDIGYNRGWQGSTSLPTVYPHQDEVNPE
jgi:hypothetical protein